MTQIDTSLDEKGRAEEDEPEQEEAVQKHLTIRVPISLRDLSALLSSVQSVFPDAYVTHDYRELSVYTPKGAEGD